MPETHTNPIATVDVVLFTLVDDRLHIALVEREHAPAAGELALPGGFVRVDEDRSLTETASRVLREKVNLSHLYIEQLYTFSGPARDPRGWSISVAYYALVPAERLRQTATNVTIVPVDERPALPFDHDEIVNMALTRARNKASYSSLPAFLLDETFTLAELQDVYQRVLEERIDRVNFRQKMLRQGVIEAVPGAVRRGQGRPAQLYRLSQPTLQAFERTL